MGSLYWIDRDIIFSLLINIHWRGYKRNKEHIHEQHITPKSPHDKTREYRNLYSNHLPTLAIFTVLIFVKYTIVLAHLQIGRGKTTG